MDARLSICIPTRNRAPYLRWTLARLGETFPRAQIIVSDNASTDDTRWLLMQRCMEYKFQERDIGPFPNMYAALAAADRQYAVYCADDDYLLPERVADAIKFMDAHPHIAAYCAPCEIWNEVEHTPYWNAWTMVAPQAFEGGVDLFNFIISQHIWPEHLIYRLPLPLKPRTRAYWAFADLPDILSRGPIHFSPMPFYRNLLIHPVGERQQLGNVQCLTHFDEYRAGLEVLAYELFGHQPHLARQKIQDMIASFICQRMDIAAQLYERKEDMTNAAMLRKRIVVADPRRDAA